MSDNEELNTEEQMVIEEEEREVEVEKKSKKVSKIKDVMSIASYLNQRGNFSTLAYNAYKNLHKGKLLPKANWDKIIK